MVDLPTALEYAAFGSSLCSAWLYGKQGIRGPIAGLFTVCLFVAFGYAAGVYAAIGANVVFAFVHIRNLRNALENDMERSRAKIAEGINYFVTQAHGAATAAGWWDNRNIDDPAVVPMTLMLMVSELVEAMEGHRKNLMDDKLTNRKQIEVELGDAMIRIADLAGKLGLDLGGAIAEKMEYNVTRPDHKPENRAGVHGKKY
ncbi:MAG: hypothetical protein JKY94_17710 [Rhodobacteraceae bacterium]|nr:hypothetical protein [Paracoccaceae bacterium]